MAKSAKQLSIDFPIPETPPTPERALIGWNFNRRKRGWFRDPAPDEWIPENGEVIAFTGQIVEVNGEGLWVGHYAPAYVLEVAAEKVLLYHPERAKYNHTWAWIGTASLWDIHPLFGDEEKFKLASIDENVIAIYPFLIKSNGH